MKLRGATTTVLTLVAVSLLLCCWYGASLLLSNRTSATLPRNQFHSRSTQAAAIDGKGAHGGGSRATIPASLILSTSEATAATKEEEQEEDDDDDDYATTQPVREKEVNGEGGEGRQGVVAGASALPGAQASPVQPARYWPQLDLHKDGLYPRLIGIGCQKCGTSSLAVYLQYVKGFLQSGIKEVHAFRGDFAHNQVNKDPDRQGRRAMFKSIDWYQSKV